SEPRTALAIVARVRDAVKPTVPLTVKMRRGLHDDAASEDLFWQILEGAFALGVNAVCVHGRTVQQRYIGPARRSFLAEVKRRFPARTILGSGDLFLASDARDMLVDTHVDGVWLGRGAIGAPWVFREIEHLLAHGTVAAPPSFALQRQAVWMHWRECVSAYGVELGARFFRAHAFKYAESHPACDDVKHALHACRHAVDVEAMLRRFYDEALRDDHFGPVAPRTSPGQLVAAGACA
ncbi:MAG TPA: tRNA-dihydrouridine synthase, partial [Myxococcota bacterium]